MTNVLHECQIEYLREGIKSQFAHKPQLIDLDLSIFVAKIIGLFVCDFESQRMKKGINIICLIAFSDVLVQKMASRKRKKLGLPGTHPHTLFSNFLVLPFREAVKNYLGDFFR